MNCECHDVPMLWHRDQRCKAGGYWHCRIKHQESSRRRYRESPELRLNLQLRNMVRIRVVN